MTRRRNALEAGILHPLTAREMVGATISRAKRKVYPSRDKPIKRKRYDGNSYKGHNRDAAPKQSGRLRQDWEPKQESTMGEQDRRRS
jgi:hypothetical protein